MLRHCPCALAARAPRCRHSRSRCPDGVRLRFALCRPAQAPAFSI
ncbi:hypothetical protein LA76x_3248 [Lysobacter antibioticus]|uniref:Uncharacterized protein n=1 Tax=Lysobacter antibioticus TaxID=84531 RepID=A0A0S2FCV0_LYSAN|nr:hypothetical protein LA76x_3248 [Lysobacter antibioticus]